MKSEAEYFCACGCRLTPHSDKPEFSSYMSGRVKCSSLCTNLRFSYNPMPYYALVHTRRHPVIVVGTPGWKWTITMFFIRRILERKNRC